MWCLPISFVHLAQFTQFNRQHIEEVFISPLLRELSMIGHEI